MLVCFGYSLIAWLFKVDAVPLKPKKQLFTRPAGSLTDGVHGAAMKMRRTALVAG